jgi:carbamoyltransferase
VLWHEIQGKPRSFVMDRADWGPEFTGDVIRETLNVHREELNTQKCIVEEIGDEEKLCRRTAEEIAAGKVVGWFQGRMEWGARALGNRSIVADPRRPEMKDVLNARIKRRESFRPFAPSILEEAVGDYFELAEASPFMAMTCRVRPEKRGVIPAPTHVDGTGRLQTVSRLTQPLYWRLIKEFENITGVPVVLNTSFNENEPIVCTPDEALDCFLRTKMDTLVMGKYLIVRREA